jgi:hypothetical protein
VDCEKFDRIVLDLLYDELDELTSAAALRHVEHCARCKGIESKLRATQRFGVLPLEPAPAGLAQRIVLAERRARSDLSLGQRAGRAISVMAGYAMRPQLAMAAVLLLVIGASLVFLRATPGERESVRVTERGVPEREIEAVAAVAPAAEAPAASPPAAFEARSRPAGEAAKDAETKGGDKGASSDFELAMDRFENHRYAEAEQLFDRVAASGGPKADEASSMAARAAFGRGGCRAALQRYEELATKHQDRPLGHEATWRVADCYRQANDIGRARQAYASLLDVPAYAARAERALESLEPSNVEAVAARQKSHVTSAPAAAAAPTKDAKPAAKPANQAQTIDKEVGQ